jgi:hypothetical protein
MQAIVEELQVAGCRLSVEERNATGIRNLQLTTENLQLP